MPYFPMFINISPKKVLIVGAGIVALRKLEKLTHFGPEIKVIAKKIAPDFALFAKKYQIPMEEKPFEMRDLDGQEIIIVATDDVPLQKAIFTKCQELKLFCNCVDSPAFCNFIFPAIVLRGDMSIGINSAGKAPGVTAQIRKQIEATLPKNLSTIIKEVEELRNSEVVKSLPDFHSRAKVVNQFIASKLGSDPNSPD